MLKLQYFGHLSEGKRRRGRQRMRWLDSITDSMYMNLSKLWETVKEGNLVCCTRWGHKEWDMTQQLNGKKKQKILELI